MADVRPLLRSISIRYRWRVALQRLGLEARSTSVVSVVERPDGLAVTLSVKSHTREAARLLSDGGVEPLSWALGSRVVALGADPYLPDIHTLLVEKAPLVAGDLPLPEINNRRGGVVSVPLGLHGKTGEPISLDLWSFERGSSHVLVAGTTGGGKSNTVGVLLAGLSASGVCLLGIDCKAGETLQPWSSVLSHPVVDPMADPLGCDELLARLVTLMERRQRWRGPNYPPVVLIVEEWASLPLKPARIGDNLERLAAQGRSASVGLIVTTQRPTSNVGAVRTSTRGNMAVRIAHSTVGDRAASEAVLGAGHMEAADVPTVPPGLALVRVGGAQLEPVQVYRSVGPPWTRPLSHTNFDDCEAWDRAAQRDFDGSARREP
jgi:FtsK/SpoIIIE family